MAARNVTWGEERIANELKLKLDIRVSPRTVGKDLRAGRAIRTPDPKHRWLTFVRNHAQVIVACDFFVVVTATFRTLYVLVMPELSTRRVLHHNVTAHPRAGWTALQFREALLGAPAYRFLIHGRDSIFSGALDKEASAMGVRIARFSHARPHISLGSGIPGALRALAPEDENRHRIAAGHTVRRAAVLRGLHHEYWLDKLAA